MFQTYADVELIPLALGQGTNFPGTMRGAKELLAIPASDPECVALRRRADHRASLLMNLQSGWTYSSALHHMVRQTLQIRLAESPDERYNRELLEHEHLRRCNGVLAPVLALPKNADYVARGILRECTDVMHPGTPAHVTATSKRLAEAER